MRALAYGALAGGLLQVAAQWPALRRLGYAGRPSFVLDADVRKVLRRIAPLTFGIGIYYVDLVLSRRFLSELGTGAQSYFSWAMRLCDFPQGIFVMALSTAALPVAVDARGQGREGRAGADVGARDVPGDVRRDPGERRVRGVRRADRRRCSSSAARSTPPRRTRRRGRSLWQGGAIWTVAAVRQTVPALYALGDTRTPVVVSAIDLCAFIGLAVALRGPMGHVGISVAVAGSSAVQMMLLLAGLRRRLGTIEGGALARSTGRTLVASVVAGVAGWGAAVALARRGVGGGRRACAARSGGVLRVRGGRSCSSPGDCARRSWPRSSGPSAVACAGEPY